jgi:hypothetical protein
MVRTLHIIGYAIAALAVVLLVGFFFYGYKPVDKATEDFLKAPTIVETFDKTKTAPSDNEQSPLVKQAGAFALYLNPPPPPEPVRSESSPIEAVRPVEVAVQFTLSGISYFADQPERSIALIDEPGKGLNWIRQGGKVQQYTISKINESSVELTSGKRKSELKVPAAKPNPLVKQAPVKTKPSEPAPTSPQPAAVEAPQEIPSSPEGQIPTESQSEDMPVPPAPPEDPAIAQKQIQLMDEMMKKIEDAEASGNLTDEQRQAIMDEFNKKMEQVNPQEAGQLENLGKELNKESGAVPPPPMPPSVTSPSPVVVPPPSMPRPPESSNSMPAAPKPTKSSRSRRTK